ncbi:MAG: NAD(P)-binding protein [Actinomycetota bacterium]|nr:NAD(P)-binding protein [Actinomycetota bacterium]
MKEVTVVGAGISGMVAAINLAREGRRVIVRERRKSVGGETGIKGLEGKVIKIGDGTPLNLERIKSYTGIDISSVAVPLVSATTYAYREKSEIEFVPNVKAYLVERGPRKTSLDVFLYEKAVSEGVRFSFEDTVRDFENLPADTIIATGLFNDAFKELGVPNMQVFGYLAMGETEDKNPKVIIYLDEYTRDYAFYSQVNGARGACLFSRGKPLDTSVKERFQRQLSENDGIEFDEWNAVNIGALPVQSARNPRLFARNFILAGTLSGTIDPMMLFGVHGALVSGKIAAMAVGDHYKALEEFRRVNANFPAGFIFSWMFRNIPLPILKYSVRGGIKAYPFLGRIIGKRLFYLLPGFGRI